MKFKKRITVILALVMNRKFDNARDSEEARMEFLEIIFAEVFPELQEQYEAWKERETEL